MALKGYTGTDAVARLMGLTFTPAQNQLCESLIPTVERAIDRETRRQWLTGQLTEDHLMPTGPLIFLRQTPILSVQSVSARADMYDTLTALTLAQTYEVRATDPACIYLPGLSDGPAYDLVRVVYTPTGTLPDTIATAAAMLIAHWMQPGVAGVPVGIQSYSVGQDLSVTFNAASVQEGLPADIRRLLRLERRFVFA